MRILFFSRAEQNGRHAFRSYYILQNLRTVKSISLIYFIFTIIIKGVFFAFHLSSQTAFHINEFDNALWIAFLTTPVFYLLSIQAIKHFTTSAKFLNLAQSLVFIFAMFIIISAMRSTFLSMHNPRNTMLMYMIGMILVSAFYTFEYYETIAITIITGATFSLLLPFYQHTINEEVLNNLASLVVLTSFFCISRYVFSYRVDNFLKIKAIEQKNIEIENASNAKNEILGVVAHDLRNPLAIIKTISMLMETDDPNADDHLENLRMIQTSCDKASSIINDLLETAQNETDNNFELEKIELHQFLDTIINEWLKNKKGQVNIIYKNTGSPLYAHIHREKMQRVMDNLIINAIKFSGVNGDIEVSTNILNDQIFIRIKDSGIGIPADMLPYIFDRFSKARRNGIRGEASVGLGLSIVSQIVKKHNGEIQVTSTEKNGTTFTIILPQVKA